MAPGFDINLEEMALNTPETPAAPVPGASKYIDSGYIDDGYFFTSRPFIFVSGVNRLELSGPSSRSGSVKLLQPEEYSTGWVRYGFTPLAILHTLSLNYSRMRQDEAAGLTAFRVVVDDTSVQFNYVNGESGVSIPCWFDEPQQELDQQSYGKYQAKVALVSTTPFITFPGAPPANLDAILATAQYSYKQTIQRKQPRVWNSDGIPRIYNKSAIKRTLHGLTLRNRNAADLGALLSYFINTAVGIKNMWTWTDGGTPHTVRFAESVINWTQSQISSQLYDVDLTLEEDL